MKTIINKGLRAACVIAGIGALHAETPDFLADTLTSDGVGYVDTGYAYKVGVTSKVTCDLHIEKRGMGDREVPAAKNIARGLFGFWKSPCISAFRFNGTGAVNNDDLQCWGQNGACQPTKSYNSQNDLVLAVDYVAGKCAWDGTTFSTDIAAPTSDSALTYWLFSINGNGSPTPFTLRSMKIYEKGDATPVCDLKPCFAKGRAALYDAAAETILYPTSDGFTLSGYDISLESGKTLAVNAASCAPRTLSIAAGSSLEFDGVHTLSSVAEVVLPDDGVVKVTLSKNTGRGKYVLIDNLPPDFSIERFAVKPIPGHQALLSKSSTELVLTLKAQGVFPDAIADNLTGDGVGHVDTEYCYNRATFPKTARMTAHFYSTDRGRAGRIGNINRAFFGFLDGSSSCISYFRFSGDADIQYDNAQLWRDDYEKKIVAAKDIPGNMAGDMYFDLDYEDGKAAFGRADAEPFDFPSSVKTATKSYWIFSANGNNSPTPLDLIRMSIYETDGVEAFLAHDYVPAVDDGKAVVYDKVTQKVLEPTSDGFSASGLSYRLSVNGEVAYAMGTVSVDCSEPEDVDGWVVLSDADDRIVESGAGTTATFDMPESPVRVVWTKNAVVVSAARLVVDSTVCYNDLTLEAGATLVFREGGKIIVAGDMTTPSLGSANVEFEGQGLPGGCVLMSGATEGSLSGLAVASVPDGLNGSLVRVGSELVLSLTMDGAENAALIARTLTSDGVGYVDTEYRYTNDDRIKTSKLVFDFYSANRGMGGAEIGVSNKTRSLFGYLNASTRNISYAKFTGNGADPSDMIQMWGDDYKSKTVNVNTLPQSLNLMKGDVSLVVDYKSNKVSFDGGVTLFDLAAPTATSSMNIWMMSANGHNYPTPLTFKEMKIYETRDGADVVAHDYLPAIDGAGEAAVYDKVAKRVLKPTSGGFVVDFGTVAQKFFAIDTVSEGMPVGVPGFGVERTFAFVRDGSVTAKFGMSSLTLSRYDASGALLSADQKTDVEAGDVFPVALDGAAKLVVTVAGPDYPSEKTVGQSFDPVDFLGVAPATCRRVKKHDYEVILAGAATLTFKTEVSEVWADNYAADGTLISSEKLSGAFAVGQSLDIPAGTAAWRVVRVAERRPGVILMVR